MSVSYTAYAVLGCKLNVERCYVLVERRQCKCAGWTPVVKFCPDCGKKAVVVSRELHPALLLIVSDRVPGLQCVGGTWDEGRQMQEVVCVGIVAIEGDHRSHSTAVDSLEAVKKQLADYLGPEGMYENFGLHAVLCCSY